ncbi:Multiple RNA-binding domain-containing protein 1 [Tieghemiomyces parasiticus]|uniref:Multiple RNA-binding domain-containing protein 1 n=1 Tax=Tieghemiomyces parasiticus TaxID=78921 RepID=A0A9W7ZRG9_9FUNG|nr:Multiple RNA-binding domain-containing protein 1 [Tieghemiomyces parasiticus]
MKTKTGTSRMFGFVGYATEKDAKQAIRHFHQTFLDTARLIVEPAKAINDASLPRPWSVHSAGSSAYEKRQQRIEAKLNANKSSATGGQKGGVEADGSAPAAVPPKALTTKQRHIQELFETTLNDPSFQEFAHVMQPRTKTKTWANDDLPASKAKAAVPKVSAQVLAVPNRKPGGAGLTVTKTHVTFKDSDDEYEDLPDPAPRPTATDPVKAAAAPTKNTKEDSASSGNDSSEEETSGSDSSDDDDSDGDAGPKTAAVSDLDWLKSRMKDTEIVADETAEQASDESDSSSSDSGSSGTESSDSDAEDDEAGEGVGAADNDTEGQTIAEAPLSAAAAALNMSTTTGSLDTKAPGYDPKELILETGRLFIRNLSYTCTEEDIRKLFETYGPLSEIHMPITLDTKQCKGFAYVLYLLPEHAYKAFQAMDMQFFLGRLLHVLPAKDKITPKELDARNPRLRETGMTSVKAEREAKRRAESRNDFNWNSLYMSRDAVLDSIADRLNVSKDEILDPDATNAAVRVAMAETHLINETKAFLEEHGLVLDSFAKRDRSETVLLVKNIPYNTTDVELRELFGKHGDLGRVLIPPAGTIAVVEFMEPVEARSAFRHLAYRKLRDAIIYLEKAPMGVFREAYDPAMHKPVPKPGVTAPETAKSASKPTTIESAANLANEAAAPATAIADDDDDRDDGPVEGSTLFIKNLSFQTEDSTFREFCNAVPGLRSALVRRRDDPKRPGAKLSMGFGFAEYGSKGHAQQALKALQGRQLDGHAVQVKLSSRGVADAATQRRAEASKKSTSKESAKLIIRNLAFQATKRDVHELVSNYGQLKMVRLPTKPQGGHRGFAFAEFLTTQEAKRVKEALAGTHLYGRHLVIEYAEKDTNNLDELRKRAGKQLAQVTEADFRDKKRRKIVMDGEEGFDSDED